jgi:DNA oxidative demethylase
MNIQGFHIYPGYLDRGMQMDLVTDLRKIVKKAPFFRPTMPRTGKSFSVEMTSAGLLGWVSDRHGGYRYQNTHPVTGQPWPAIPKALLSIWDDLTGYQKPPECCLINLYRGEKPKMGLHRDEDEQDLDAPVVSISLGDTAIFRMGGLKRNDPTSSIKLASGDIVTFGGDARLNYHGIDRVIANSSTLLHEGGRTNLTLRRVHL